MEIGIAEDLMIKSVLVAGLLLTEPTFGSGAGHLPVSVFRIAADFASVDGNGWKDDALKPLNLDFSVNKNGSACSIAVTIDRAALLAELPMLQRNGAVSKSITEQEMARKPASHTNALSLLLTSYAVRSLYGAHPELGPTRWKVSVTGQTDAGGQGAREIYSFAFDRPLYERTAWDRLPFTEFPKVAAEFSYNLRFTLDMSHEISGSIDDD